MMKKFTAMIVICGCIVLAASAAMADEALQAQLFPDRIGIGTFYNGDTISMNGTLPADCNVVVRVTGADMHLKMKKKGKVLGLLWLNRDTVNFDAVPEAFLLYTSGKFDALLDGRQKQTPVWQLGLTALEDRIVVTPVSPERSTLIQDLLKLKENEGFYAVNTTGIRYTPLSGDQKKFDVTLGIPPKLPPGAYRVEAYAVRHGDIVSTWQHPLTVKLESFPKVLSSLAFDRSALYGILATLVAVVAGLFIGVFFGGGKGGH